MKAIEIGKTYKVDHSRKGRFTARVLNAGETWATLEIVEGQAVAMLASNGAGKGEELQIRISHATFVEL